MPGITRPAALEVGDNGSLIKMLLGITQTETKNVAENNAAGSTRSGRQWQSFKNVVGITQTETKNVAGNNAAGSNGRGRQ